MQFTRLISLPQWNPLDQTETEVGSRYQSDLFSYPVSCKCHGVIKPSDTIKQFELPALPTALTRQQSWRKKVKNSFLQACRWWTWTAGLAFVRPDSTPNKLNSWQHVSVLFAFLCLLGKLCHTTIPILRSPEQRMMLCGFICMSVPQNSQPIHSLLRVAELCLIWKQPKSYSIFSFYRRWFIIAVQLFFQLELKFIMWFCSPQLFVRGHRYIE